MKQHCYWGMLVFAMLFTGCKQSSKEEKPEPVKVKTIRAEVSNLNSIRGFSGTVEEVAGSIVSFPLGGTVKNIRVSAGKEVYRGELIALVDECVAQSNYDASVAALGQVRDAHERLKQLHESGSLPEIRWIEVQSQLKQAVAAEQIARKNLNDCKLYAPFSGVISDKYVETGQNVMPGMPVAKLVSIDHVKIKVAVPENEIAHVKTGQTARIIVSALSDKVFEGKIVEKGVTAHPLSRSYEVKALVQNTGSELMPGMVCRMQIQGMTKSVALRLPAFLVQLDDRNGSFVWVHEAGKARKRKIRSGEMTNQGVIIENGLSPGDEIISEGQQKVNEGTRIVVIK